MQSNGDALNLEDVADMARATNMLCDLTRTTKLFLIPAASQAADVAIRCHYTIKGSEEWLSFHRLVFESNAPVRFVLHWALCKDLLRVHNDKNTEVFDDCVRRTLFRYGSIAIDRDTGRLYRLGTRATVVSYELAYPNESSADGAFDVNIKECKEARLSVPAMVDRYIHSMLTAFAMASHARLGSISLLSIIPDEFFPVMGSMLRDMFNQEFAELLRLVQ